MPEAEKAIQNEQVVTGSPDSVSAVGAAEQPAAAGSAGSVAALEEQLRAAEQKAAEHYDAWLRAKAETDNIRKRAEAEVVAASKFAVEGFATQLLAVRDSLETTLTVENASLDSLREGVALTLKLLTQAFDKFQIAEISPQGEKFDPHRHQAMTALESDQAPNTVLQVMQKGYTLNDRVIRPALVVVSKARDA